MKPTVKFAVAVAVAGVAVATSFADDALSGAFRTPPPEARPHTWWHWMNGNVTKAGITADLEAMAAAGIGGAHIFDAGLALPKGPVDFASEAWYDCIVHADREAKRLGIELVLANCSGWTSSGGPWITPELSMKYVTNTTVRVAGGERFRGALPLPDETNGFYEDIAVLAFPADAARPSLASLGDFDFQVFRTRGNTNLGPAEGGPVMPSRITGAVAPREACLDPSAILDLTAHLDADGRLDWTAPAGHASWTVLRIGYMANARTNRSASKAGLGLECDKLDPHALDVHFDAYVGEVLRRTGPGRALTGVLLDSYEVFGQNWTRGFDAAFAARAGYSITNFLPVFAGYPVESAAATQRFCEDLRRVVSDMFVENYAGRLRARCRENGLQFYCEPYGNGPFNDLAFARECDVPMSEFWRPRDADVSLAALARGEGRPYMECRWGNKPLGNGKTVAAAAHVWGRRIVGAEAFTSYPDAGSGRWAESPFAMKAQCDRVYSDGVNHMVFHRFVHQPWTSPAARPGMTMAAYGAHFDRTQTWWDHGGPEFFRYMARVQAMLQRGVFAADVLVCLGGAAPDYGTGGEIPSGYAGDRCHPDALAAMKIDPAGGVIAPGGVRYRVIAVPEDVVHGAAAAHRLAMLAAAGIPVVPCAEAADAMRRLGLAPDVTCDDRDATWLHRRDGDDEIYFVAVPAKERKTVRCSFRAAADSVELWDPVTGEIAAANASIRDGRTEVALDCTPAYSVFVVFRKRPTEGLRPARPAGGAAATTATATLNRFRIAFREPGAAADVAVVENGAPGSWTESENPDVKYFSGTATYTAECVCPAGEGRVALDLGRVREIAEVTVNGRAYPALWKPPYVLDVTDAVKPGERMSVEIKVTNLWPNRLIGDAALPDDCEWDDGSQSKGYPLVKSFPGWLARGEKSPTGRHAFSTCRFWPAGAPLLDSGLLDPVTVSLLDVRP